MEHDLTAEEAATCGLLTDMMSVCHVTETVVIPASICGSDTLAVFVAMVKGGEMPAALPLAATISLMRCSEFFVCERVTVCVIESFLANYLYDKSAKECLVAMGMSADTEFTAEERAEVLHEFPYMCNDDIQ